MRLHLFGSLLHGVLGTGRQGCSPWGSCRGQGRHQAGPHGRSTSTGTMLHYVISGCEETAATHHAMYAVHMQTLWDGSLGYLGCSTVYSSS